MKTLLRSQLMAALAAGLALATASCSSKVENNIVGKWSHGDKTTVTFTTDGAAINEENGKTETGQYSISNVLTLRLKLPGVGAPMDFDVIQLTDREMILSGHSIKTDPIKFTRLSN